MRKYKNQDNNTLRELQSNEAKFLVVTGRADLNKFALPLSHIWYFKFAVVLFLEIVVAHRWPLLLLAIN